MRRDVLRGLGAEWSVVAAFALGVSIFRLGYYGRLTPNTHLLKLGGFALRDRLPNGMGFVGPFLDSTALLLVLALPMAALDGSRLKLSIAGLVAVATTYQVWVGGDFGPPWRMMAPVMPLFCGLLVVEIVTLVDRRAAGRRVEEPPSRKAVARRGLEAATIAVLSLAAMVRLNAGFGDDVFFGKSGYLAENTDANRGNVDTALALKTVTLPTATVGVSWAGAIPFYSERSGVDSLGKCDPRIAALPPDTSGRIAAAGMKSIPGHNGYDLAYSIQERQPTYIQEYRWGRQNLRAWVAQHYVSVLYRGTFLCLLENSPHVDWRLVPPDRRRGCDESVMEALWNDSHASQPAAGRPGVGPARRRPRAR